MYSSVNEAEMSGYCGESFTASSRWSQTAADASVVSYSQQAAVDCTDLLERNGLNPLHGVDVKHVDSILTVH